MSRSHRYLPALIAVVTVAALVTVGKPAGATTPPAFAQVEGSPFHVGGTPFDAQFNAAGTLLAVAESGAIGMFSVNTSTGALTELPGSPYPDCQCQAGGWGDPVAVQFSPDGRFLAVGDDFGDTVEMYSVTVNGAITPVPGSPFFHNGISNSISFSANGKFLAVGSDSLGSGGVAVYAVNGTTGALAQIPGSPFAGTFPYKVAYGGSSILAVADPLANLIDLYVADPNTGALTFGSSEPANYAYSVAASPNANEVAVSAALDHTVELFTVSGGTMTPAPGSPLSLSSGAFGVGFNTTGTLLGAAEANAEKVDVYSVAGSGAATPVVGSPFDVSPAGGPSSIGFSVSGLLASADQDDGDVTMLAPTVATNLAATPINHGGISAVLTRSDTNQPLPGESLTFVSGTHTLCTAITDASGKASCPSLSAKLTATVHGGYTVTFAGNGNYLPSSAKAGLNH